MPEVREEVSEGRKIIMGMYPKGSEWRRWDLHVHTPKSIIQGYGGDNKTAWDAFIQRCAIK